MVIAIRTHACSREGAEGALWACAKCPSLYWKVFTQVRAYHRGPTAHVGCELPQQHTSTDNGFDNMPPVTLGLFLAALYMKLPPTIQSKKGSKPVNHLAHEASRGKKAYLKDGQKA